MKLYFNLKYRELNENHMIILMNYLNKKISWIDAHNKLIPLGVNLTENGYVFDY